MSSLYGVAMAALGKSGLRQRLAILTALVSGFPLASLAGLVPGGLLFACLLVAAEPSPLRMVGLLAAVVVAFVGVLLGILVAGVAKIAAVPENGWGLCTGMTEPSNSALPALVPWLAARLDQIAGKPSGSPLTFGDLEGRGVTLRMISTNLTNGRPYTLPFGEHTHFYFKDSELMRFFPAYVVDWMKKNPGKPGSRAVEDQGLSLLPDAKDLPVIVAIRMSLSFPFLFCPVPFYGVDFEFGPKDPATQKPIPEPCFFIDGGLTSNFPLNLFDKPLPRWPTFGINLRDIDQRHKQQIYIACNNQGGLEEWWTRFDQNKGLGGLASFLMLMFDTSRNWRDNLQLSVPGYRDRVVHIGLDPHSEGGLNLDMPDSVIQVLTARGQAAGGAILSRYNPTANFPRNPQCIVGIDNQKWVRFRSFLELFEETVLSIGDAIPYQAAGEPTYEDFLEWKGDTPHLLDVASPASLRTGLCCRTLGVGPPNPEETRHGAILCDPRSATRAGLAGDA